MDSFKNGINEFKTRCNFTLKELGEKLGVSGGLVGNWCQGRGVPSFDLVKKLFCLGMTLKEMFGDSFPNIGFENSDFVENSCKSTSIQDVEKFLLNLDVNEFYKFIEVVQHKRFRKNQFHALLNMGYSEEDAKKLDLEFEKENLERSTPEFQKSIHEEMDKLFNSK